VNLSARAIALQGIGFTPILIAVQGLLGAEIAPPPASGGKPLRVRPSRPPQPLEWVSDYVFDDAEARKRKRKRAEVLLLMH